MGDLVARGLAKQSKDYIGNIFTMDNINVGYMVNTNGQLLQSSTYSATDFIPVQPMTQYLFSKNVRSIAFYDENKAVISSSAFSYSIPRENLLVKTHPSARFVRVASHSVNMENGKYTIVPIKNPTKWLDKTWSSFGDSITGQAKWQPYINDAFGFRFFNYGVGGSKVSDPLNEVDSMCRDERINQINVSSNLITFMGGTNDWLQNVPLGTISDTGVDTFYGAVKKTLEKLIVKFPTVRIISMTTPFGKAPNRSSFTDKYGLKNNLNLTTQDYGKVIMEVSKMYGIPCVDVNGEAGWNDFNIASYVQDEGSFLHPNDEGGKRIAELVAGKLKTVELIY